MGNVEEFDKVILFTKNFSFENKGEDLNEIKNNNSPDDIDGSGLDGLKAQIVLEAAVQSIKKEKVIKIKDVFTIWCNN